MVAGGGFSLVLVPKFYVYVLIFKVKSLFFMEMKNGWTKKFIIWVILRYGNGSRIQFYFTPIIPGGYNDRFIDS